MQAPSIWQWGQENKVCGFGDCGPFKVVVTLTLCGEEGESVVYVCPCMVVVIILSLLVIDLPAL